MNLRKTLMVTLMSFFACMSTHAEEPKATIKIITSCGSSEGYSYYHQNEGVKPSASGFVKDKISNGKFIVAKTGDKYNLLYRSAGKKLQTVEDGGGLVMPIFTSKTSLGLLVIYPESGVSETYNFQNLGTDKAGVSWTQTRSVWPIAKSALYFAKCGK